jgi:hypothetical protein
MRSVRHFLRMPSRSAGMRSFRRRFSRGVLAAALAPLGLLLLSGVPGEGRDVASFPDGSGPIGIQSVGIQMEGASLEPGHLLILASWVCSFPRLDRVNELALELIEDPLSRQVANGSLVGWGQLNGQFRDEYNYHTYYIARSQQEYRQALGQVLNHMSRERQAEMEEFYQHCSRTRELVVNVVTARP